MNTPFTSEQFFKVFENYNSAIFPAQIIIAAIALTLWFGIVRNNHLASRIFALFLGILWIWIGIVYHLLLFSTINPAANAFGLLFILEGIVILFEYLRGSFQFETGVTVRHLLGHFFTLFGLIVYPIISYIVEGGFSGIITLGLPCPTVIMTFGLFLLAKGNFRRYLLLLPTLWAIIGISAALNFGVYQDFMLPVSALLADFLLLRKRQSPRAALT